MSILSHSNRPRPFETPSDPERLVESLLSNVERVLIGKRKTVKLCVAAMLARGHVLIEDVPGTGKTLLAKALARSLDCSFSRIQFTPDLLPADVTGASVYHPVRHDFAFRKGPLFAHVVLADELNRTPARTQAALLEAMEERQVTADGTSYALPEPFLLLATQNAMGGEGAYPLPEAQLDRFLLQVSLGYPTLREEADILGRQGSGMASVDRLRPVLLREELLALQEQAARIHVDEALCEYIARLSEATRSHPDAKWGASPRASLALLRAAKAHAFLSGRSYLLPDDVKEMVLPVLTHRMVLTSAARYAGRRSEELVSEVVDRTPIPGLQKRGGRS
ncbi:MoxR family ATPase [Gorillibacterium sp. CAU 1737]|uniref:AAA family ATPase n=1 Tax=Gorillibacterium sp. CAU 1737 TaxID=3140362 RepID=UPI00325FE36B